MLLMAKASGSPKKGHLTHIWWWAWESEWSKKGFLEKETFKLKPKV